LYPSEHHDENTKLKQEFICKEDRVEFETDERFEWINKHAKSLLLLLWTGDLVKLTQGQGSGRFCTTFDNILTHMRIAFYHYFRVLAKFSLPLPRLVEEIRSVYRIFVFGDDSQGSSDYKQLQVFEERRLSYEQCGMILKSDGDFESTSIIGLPFLGATCAMHEGRIVFEMDPVRVIGSLSTLEAPMTLRQRFERCFGIFMNCVFTYKPVPGTDLPVVEFVYRLLLRLRRELGDIDLGSLTTILSIETYQRRALGMESGGFSWGVFPFLSDPFRCTIGSILQHLPAVIAEGGLCDKKSARILNEQCQKREAQWESKNQ
jgi:hypothetical protein